MFGDNPIRSISYDPTQLAVEEVFYTIQGEGPYAGQPALFIRLAGCNLACTFCDTEFEKQAEKLTPTHEAVQKILAIFTPEQRRFVVMTGGEPMRQNWVILAERLIAEGTELIQVETAGTLWQPDLETFIKANKVELVCSPKTPNVHPLIKEYCYHWKYVISAGRVDSTDGLPNYGTQQATKEKRQRLFRPERSATRYEGTIWLSPCDEYQPHLNKANQQAVRDLCLQYGYRVSLQMHKIIGVA